MIYQALVSRPSDRDPEEIVRFVNSMIENYDSDIRFYAAFDEKTGNEAILCAPCPIEDSDAELAGLLLGDSVSQGALYDGL